MFIRLLLISGLIAMGLTALIYIRFMVPGMDVTTVPPVQQVTLPDGVTASADEVVSVHGTIDRTGTSLLGKQQVLLTDSAGTTAIMATFVVGYPLTGMNAGDTITVLGIWQPMEANHEAIPVVVGTMTDCMTAY